MYFFLSYILVSSWLVFMFASERVEKDSKAITIGNVWGAVRQIFKKPVTKKWVLITMGKRMGLDGAMSILSIV